MHMLALALLTSTLTSTLASTGQPAQALEQQLPAVVRSASDWPAPEPFTPTGQPPDPSLRFDPGSPQTKAATKLLELVAHIEQTRTDTVYTHSTRVRRKDGVYHFDCSGMLNWMLPKVSKRALETLDRERPVAATYVRTILAAPTTRARDGWQQIADIEDVEPGDLFAWKRPANWPKGGNTGHVGIVIAKPLALPDIEGAYLVRVIDSTRWKHQDDSRGSDETGFGMGTILFMTDAQRRPIGYAWAGIHSSGFYRTDVAFGRVH